MSRVILGIVALTAICLSAMSWQTVPEQKEKDIDQLKKERIEVLEKRVELARTLFEHGRMDRVQIVQPEKDLIHAKLEYATTNAEKKRLYEALIKLMDSQIEVARLHEEKPVLQADKAHLPGLELLQLQSEKIRLQIEMESLGE